MKQLWANGSFRRSDDAETIPVLDPATELVLDEVPRANKTDVETLVSAAHAAFLEWRSATVAERTPLLHGIASALRGGRAELAELLTKEGGKPLRDSQAELDLAADTFDYFAELARNSYGRMIPPGDRDQLDFVVNEPYGVTACIIPWNFPIQLLSWKMAPALAAANTVVILPSPMTPLATLRFAEMATSHLPPGVVNVVTGYGPEVGEELIKHPLVRHVAFTGSLENGQRVAGLAAGLMKKVTLELGGKDAFVVGPDADFETAVPALAFAGLLHAGQCCTSTERVYVPAELFDKFAETTTDFVRQLRLGPGMDPETDMGPMINDSAVSRVESDVAEAVSHGARVLVGGKRPAGVERGYFFEPTVIVDVEASSALMTKETFGPILPLTPYQDFSDAIRMVNSSKFGLGASLLSHDAGLAKQFFEEVEAGTIYINDPLTPSAAAPFGGMKMSGMGRELGMEGLDEFRQVKHIHWDVAGRLKPAWRAQP